MDRNVRIAKELVRLAKSLIAENEYTKLYRVRNVNDVSIGFVEFELIIPADNSEKSEHYAETNLDKIIDKIADKAISMGLDETDIETDKNCWYNKEHGQYEDYVRFTLNHGGNNAQHYNDQHFKIVNNVVEEVKKVLALNKFKPIK